LITSLYVDPAFVAESRNFIAVHLDGDAAGAQERAEKLGAVGYPTLLVLDPSGVEITRLDPQLQAPQIVRGLAAARRVGTSLDHRLAQAMRDPHALSHDDWQVLDSFDWDDDPVRIPTNAKEQQLQNTLASNAPTKAERNYFRLLHLNTVINTKENSKLDEGNRRELRDLLMDILPDERQIIPDFKGLANLAPAIAANASDAGTPDRLVAMYIHTMRRLRDERTLPLADRLQANLAVLQATPKGQHGRLVADVVADVHQKVEELKGKATTVAARQAVLGAVFETLDETGDIEGAQDYLKAEIARSPWPYYAMTHLAGQAELHGTPAVAIDWARRAQVAAAGPASKLEWSVMYSTTVMRLAPKEVSAVQASNGAVFAALSDPDVDFYQRNRSNAKQWHSALMKWSAQNAGASILHDMDARLKNLCAAKPGPIDRTNCRTAFEFSSSGA
jgi:protein disulfide-isomerase